MKMKSSDLIRKNNQYLLSTTLALMPITRERLARFLYFFCQWLVNIPMNILSKLKKTVERLEV